MNTKKLFVAAGLILQLTSGLHADNWSDAFAAFGGTQTVKSGNGSLAWSTALAEAKKIGTPEALAVGMYMADGNPAVLVNKFKGAASSEDLQKALQPAVQAPVATNANSGANSWFGGSSNKPATPVEAPKTAPASSWFSSKPAAPVVSLDDLKKAEQKAAEAQQKLDAAAATANTQALSTIVNSGKSGVAQYTALVDHVFNSLQQAVSGIEDSAAQQQVMQYIQNKAASIKASVRTNSYNSRVIGRMNSSKVTKRNRK